MSIFQAACLLRGLRIFDAALMGSMTQSLRKSYGSSPSDVNQTTSNPITLGDDHPVTFVEHFLGDAVMPCLYNPILGQIDCLLFVCQRIVPQNQRFAWQKVFEPLQERLEQLVVVISLPDICYFIAAKVMHRRPEIAVDSGDQIGDVVVGVPMPDVQLCIWSFQICLAYYQALVPYSP
jgi:hypothetical protein